MVVKWNRQSAPPAKDHSQSEDGNKVTDDNGGIKSAVKHTHTFRKEVPVSLSSSPRQLGK